MRQLSVGLLVILTAAPCLAADAGWIMLFGSKDTGAWEKPSDDWLIAGVVELDAKNPRMLATKPGGEWQTFDIVFKAPRFDADGKKTAHARFIKVVHNDKLVHENVEVEYPTGSAWRLKKEVATGPLLLQGDHGPVAFRNVKIRPFVGEGKKD